MKTLRDNDSGRGADPAPADAVASGFLEYLRVRGAAPATVKARASSLRCWLAWLARRGIDDVKAATGADITAYLAWLRREGYGEPTQHVRLITLRRFYEWLERTDALLVNPCAGIALPKLPRRLPRTVLTEEQARAILAQPNRRTARGKRDRAILETLYATGLRAAELTQLTLADVDLKHALVRVEHGKGGMGRLVPLGKQAVAALAAYVQGPRAQWTEQQPNERALWLGFAAPHRPLQQQSLSLAVAKYARAAGIKARPHAWRHTCATHLVSHGANIAYVQRLLGHASLETTQVYTRVAIADVARTHRTRHPRRRALHVPEYPAPVEPTAGGKKP